jgi:hypothetical protein
MINLWAPYFDSQRANKLLFLFGTSADVLVMTMLSEKEDGSRDSCG